PAYNERYKAFMQKLWGGIFSKVDAAHKKDPKDDKASILWLRILADQSMIGETEVRQTAELLFRNHADDADVRLAYAKSLMVVPVRNAADGRPPVFEKALEVLEPLAKTQTTNADVQLLYGVAASAMDKNEVAKAALDSIAAIGSVRPSARILIGRPEDPSEAY